MQVQGDSKKVSWFQNDDVASDLHVVSYYSGWLISSQWSFWLIPISRVFTENFSQNTYYNEKWFCRKWENSDKISVSPKRQQLLFISSQSKYCTKWHKISPLLLGYVREYLGKIWRLYLTFFRNSRGSTLRHVNIIYGVQGISPNLVDKYGKSSHKITNYPIWMPKCP